MANLSDRLAKASHAVRNPSPNKNMERRTAVTSSLTNTSPAYKRAMSTGAVKEIALEDLVDAPKEMNRFQPLNKELMGELMASIRKNGLQHNIVVWENEDLTTYTILSGHNRVRAFRELNKLHPGEYETIMAIVNPYGSLTQEEAIERIIDTNVVQRKLTIREEIDAARQKVEILRKTKKPGQSGAIKELASLDLGWSRKKIDKLFNVDNLIPELYDLVKKNVITFTNGSKLGMFAVDKQKFLAENAFDYLNNKSIGKLKYNMSNEELLDTLTSDYKSISISQVPKEHYDTLVKLLQDYNEKYQLNIKLK